MVMMWGGLPVRAELSAPHWQGCWNVQGGLGVPRRPRAPPPHPRAPRPPWACLREPRAARGQKLFRRAGALNMDALVRTVPAGDVTKAASDTKLRMNARHD